MNPTPAEQGTKIRKVTFEEWEELEKLPGYKKWHQVRTASELLPREVGYYDGFRLILMEE